MQSRPLGALFSAALLLASPDQAQQPAATSLSTVAQDLDRLTAACNRFAADLYARLREHGNPTCSPGSVAMALHMLLAGAGGETAAQIAKALHLPDDLRGERLRRAVDALITVSGKRATDGPEMRLVNDLWVQDGYHLLPTFSQALRDDFHSPAQPIDFAADPGAARDRINRHIAEATNQRIPDLLPGDAIDELTRVVLTNALWFKGAWATPFRDGGTAPAPFHLTTDEGAGEPVDVETMHVTELFALASDARWQCVVLPFANSPMQMEIMVPVGAATLAEAEDVLLAGAHLAALQHQRVHVALPRFGAVGKHDLPAALEALGVVDAFGGRADFSPINGQHDLFVSQAVHRTWVEVDEAGAEAAAATAIVLKKRGMPHGDPIDFRADRPFAFAIRDRGTGLCWFAGRVEDPRGKQ
ncbi:MAG: serpin family protein [Planctomycetes bacterium]|nr:serpin family protein [Planctomycetota bacterium]